MYTRNQGSARPSSGMKEAPPAFSNGISGAGADNSGGMPILIPQDYRGEFLRGHHTSLSDTAVSEVPQTAEPEPAAPVKLPPTDADTVSTAAEYEPHSTAGSERVSGHGNSLFGGLYDLLLGENSSEEETLLLLGIALLLLWGHLDRGGLFDRSTWESDDLALLLIGYLLLS